jgi:glycosyltransferase involved in cell wall biosynthesis
LQYIIIDGGSTDATVSIINAYRGKVAHFVSEPDRGIYDAMNKGISLASGEWLYFLGADDMLASNDIIQSVFLADLTRYSLIIGDVVAVGSGKRYVSKYDWRLLFKNTISHQGAFYRRALFESFLYDTNTRISGDYELNLKAYLEKRRAKKVTSVIASCGNGGVSKMILYHGYLEEIRIRSKYLSWPLAAILNLLTLGRFALKRASRLALLGTKSFRN